MLKIIIVFTIFVFALALHAHQLPTVEMYHIQANTSISKTSEVSTNITSLIDKANSALTEKDANKYQQLITNTQSIKDNFNNLQSVLTKYHIPVNSSSTTCPGVTTFNRTQIRKTISQLQQKAAGAAKYISTCLDCGFVSNQILQIQKAINSYDQNINKTLDGLYCKSQVQTQKAVGLVDLKNSFFKNNLKAKNWYYGTTTASDYKIYAFKRASTYNLTSCPLSIPFVQDKEQTCFNCPQGSIFNLGTQKCDTCKPNQILNIVSGKCDECVGEKVFTNGQLVCKLCNLSEGYLFNSTSLKCYKCGKNRYLNEQKRECVDFNCDVNTPRFNLTTKKCQACGDSEVIDPNDATRCIETNYIGICPPQTPKYDLNTKKCVECPSETVYNRGSHECQKPVSNHFMPQNNQ